MTRATSKSAKKRKPKSVLAQAIVLPPPKVSPDISEIIAHAFAWAQTKAKGNQEATTRYLATTLRVCRNCNEYRMYHEPLSDKCLFGPGKFKWDKRPKVPVHVSV